MKFCASDLVKVQSKPHQVKMHLRGTWGQQRPRSDCTNAQSGPSLSADRLDTIECFNGEQMLGCDLVHVHDDVNLHVLHMFEGSFMLDMT